MGFTSFLNVVENEWVFVRGYASCAVALRRLVFTLGAAPAHEPTLKNQVCQGAIYTSDLPIYAN
jgi:hypothetical protein